MSTYNVVMRDNETGEARSIDMGDACFDAHELAYLWYAHNLACESNRHSVFYGELPDEHVCDGTRFDVLDIIVNGVSVMAEVQEERLYL